MAIKLICLMAVMIMAVVNISAIVTFQSRNFRAELDRAYPDVNNEVRLHAIFICCLIVTVAVAKGFLSS